MDRKERTRTRSELIPLALPLFHKVCDRFALLLPHDPTRSEARSRLHRGRKRQLESQLDTTPTKPASPHPLRSLEGRIPRSVKAWSCDDRSAPCINVDLQALKLCLILRDSSIGLERIMLSAPACRCCWSLWKPSFHLVRLRFVAKQQDAVHSNVWRGVQQDRK